MTRAWRFVSAAAVSLILGAAVSWLKMRYHCRLPTSEACVWAKAYFPIALPVESIFFGVTIFIAILVTRRFISRG